MLFSDKIWSTFTSLFLRKCILKFMLIYTFAIAQNFPIRCKYVLYCTILKKMHFGFEVLSIPCLVFKDRYLWSFPLFQYGFGVIQMTNTL